MANSCGNTTTGPCGVRKMNGLSATETVMLRPDQVDPAWKVVGFGDLGWRRQAGDREAAPNGWVALRAWFMNGEALEQDLFLTPNIIEQQRVANRRNGRPRRRLSRRPGLAARPRLVVVWYMDGVNLMGGASILGVSRNDLKIVGAGDIDGVKKPDLVWQQTSGGLVGAWLLNGARQPVESSSVPVRRLPGGKSAASSTWTATAGLTCSGRTTPVPLACG